VEFILFHRIIRCADKVSHQVADMFRMIIDRYDGYNGAQISCSWLMQSKKCLTSLFKIDLGHINFMINNPDLVRQSFSS
jgi:hypothetical protein